MPLDIDESWSYEILESKIEKFKPSSNNEDEIVTEAMRNPIGSPTLRELASGKNNVVIICSDHTRPVPSNHIIPHMLAEIRSGNADAQITLLIATGFHRGSSKEELINKFGRKIVEREHIVVHDCRDDDNMEFMGTLPSGSPLYINKIAANADLLLSEGFIETHFFAGFSGGRKSVLPGVASYASILACHCAEFIDSEYARTGILARNPIHTDMVAAAKMANLKYIVNVTINSEKKVVAAFAGDAILAHNEGCKTLSKYCSVAPSQLADIAISTNGGYPLDQNMYQSVKGMTAAEAASKDDAVIIMVAGCLDGHGGESFYTKLKDNPNKQKIMDKILATKREDTIPDQWEIQIQSRILINHRVIYVIDPNHQKMAQEMGFEVTDDLNQALAMALKIKGTDAHIAIITDGVSVMVTSR